MKLREMKGIDFDVYHEDVDDAFAAVCLGESPLGDWMTEAGEAEFKAVLDAEIRPLNQRDDCFEFVVSGCAPDALSKFTYSLAGYCSCEQWDAWFHDPDDVVEPDEFAFEEHDKEIDDPESTIADSDEGVRYYGKII